MKNPFFSIVLPSYNRAHILRETISSILTQTYSNWELLVIDDGSTDDTKTVIEKIKDERIKYIYQENAERSAARNNGIRKAKGQYICFLDSDDLFEPQHLQTLFEKTSLRNFPIELLFTNCFYLTNGIKEKPTLADLTENSLVYLLKNSVIPARICIHKNILENFNFKEDIVIVEDTVLWATIANKYPVTHIPKYTVQYRLHDDNSVNIKNNCFLPRLKGLQKLFENKEIVEKAGKDLTNEILSDCYIGIYKHYVYKSNKLKQLSTIIKAIIYYPHIKLKMKIYLLLSSLPVSSLLIQLKERKK